MPLPSLPISRKTAVVIGSVVGGVAVLALGAVLTAQAVEGTVARRAAAVRIDGALMQIDLVTPPPKDVASGSRMGVGDLVDGYEHRELPPPPDLMDAAWDPAWDEAEPFMEPVRPPSPSRNPYAVEPDLEEPQEEVRKTEPEPHRRARPSFGFDQPRPDFAEDRRRRREARQARMEAMDRRENAARLDEDTAFY